MSTSSGIKTQTLGQFVEVSSYFQRAVHLRYDLENSEALDRYVPTQSAVEAIGGILKGIQISATQRSYVLHAAYGSGKSLFAVALAALLSQNPQLSQVIQRLEKRIHFTDKTIGEQLSTYLDSDIPRLLPVVLVGDEGDLGIALPRALGRTLKHLGIEISLNTRFQAALQTISSWQQNYPDTYHQLERLLIEQQSDLDHFKKQLQAQEPDAYTLFEELYPILTAGSQFDASKSEAPNRLFSETAEKLKPHGYDGIMILWDEFGRYLEARVSRAFGEEAAMLQDLAETCNYSDEHQVHLLLFAHKELQSYAIGLPKNYQQEWSRIEGRFQRFDVTNDPLVAYKLIASAFSTRETPETNHLLNVVHNNGLVSYTLDNQLFPLLSSADTLTLLRNTWPLHPLTVFSLARLSNRVAQNERTMFTFLTVNERDGFTELLNRIQIDSDDPFVRPGALWDYFQNAVRTDSGIGGTHQIWSGVVNALDKVPQNDRFTQEIVKTLGVLLIASEGERTRPTSELLCWAMGAETQDQRAAVIQSLENLRRRKVVIHRQVDGYWNFTTGSDIDFETRLREVLERSTPNKLQLRRTLEKLAPPPYTVARRYNQRFAMTRFFTGLYRWPHEVEHIPWLRLIEDLNQTDGVVIYILPTKDITSQSLAQYLPDDPRIVFATLDENAVTFKETLRELYGLYQLNNDPMLKRQDDRERIQRELNYLIEDTETRLRRQLENLVNPRSGHAIWMTYAQPEGQRMQSSGQATRFVSEICASVFSQTPVINNEGINKHEPTSQQIRATEKVIEALFTSVPAPQMGLEGRGPEILVCNTVLESTGILRKENDVWVIDRPIEENEIQKVWDFIEAYVLHCQQEGPRLIKDLISQLTSPPYGLRLGVIPVLLAAVISSRLRAITVRKNGRAQHPINGCLITDLINKPDDYLLEVGEWNENLERLWNALETQFTNYMHEADYYQEPLSRMKVAMLRWLQSLPRFCRDTRQLAPEVLRFRSLIRDAQSEPATVFTKRFPELLDKHIHSQEALENRMDSLMSAVGAAYLDLQTRLDQAAQEIFNTSQFRTQDGFEAMQQWLRQMEVAIESPITEFRFSSPITQAFVDTLVANPERTEGFWGILANAVSGLHLRDWTDQSETNFVTRLQTAREEIETETQTLLADDANATAVSIQFPTQEAREFRFRSTDLSNHGQSVLQNLINTLKIAGRPLSADERRLITVELLRHVMGDEQND